MSPSTLSSGSKQQEPEGHCGDLVTIKWIQTGSLSALAPEDASSGSACQHLGASPFLKGNLLSR